MEWILWITLTSIYIVCIFTVCLLTFNKGHWVLGIIGVVFPILWLIGAVIPAKPGSRYAIEQQAPHAYV
jgi:hypothetical protein